MSNVQPDKVKPKRGRKPKTQVVETKTNEVVEPVVSNVELEIVNETEKSVEIAQSVETEQSVENFLIENETNNENVVLKTAGKKRGRKPKGGKIIQQTSLTETQKETKPNIILHLKCSLKDLQTSGDYNSNFTCSNIDSYQFSGANDLSYEVISSPDEAINNIESIGATSVSNIPFNEASENSVCETKEIWKKLKFLEHNLHVNNISDKKSACFWCSYDFDNPPIYIPKHQIKDSYNVYGCFCTPECATAHLMEENIDSSTKFERYYLLNHIYSKIFQYTKNIKPAPNPHYMLERYYGNLTIQEYRALLKSERLFLIVDKPLTRILPEFHEDNDDFIINNKIIPSSNFQLKRRLQKKQTKNNILNEKFGIST
jgi:hypothetical protein